MGARSFSKGSSFLEQLAAFDLAQAWKASRYEN